jgi:hypothetical protein
MESQHTREHDKNRETTQYGGEASSNQGMSKNTDDKHGTETRNPSDDRGRAGMLSSTVEAARNVGEQAWSAASAPVATAQDMARRAREQTGAAGDTLYQQGARAGEYVTRNINEYPLTALMIAGAVGYGIAYLVHGGWQTGENGSSSARREHRGEHEKNRRRHD